MDTAEIRSTDRLTADEVLEAIDYAEAKRFGSKRFRTPYGLPHVSFLSADPQQRLVWCGENRLRIEGVAARRLGSPAFHMVTVDGWTARLTLAGGEGPLSVAHRMRAALPKGYAATVKTGRPMTAFAEIFFWRA
jgi:hypothetical protein